MKDPLLRDCRYLSSSSPSSLSSLTSSSSSSTSTSSQRSTISTSESGQELWPVGVKLGIVRLGYSAGKLKYTLVDEQDIVLAREYTFEARLEVDPSSAGAVVFAYAYLTHQPHSSPSSSSSNDRQMILLQDLIWRRHYGPIPERKRVVHRNHISMDNRLDNLCLIDLGGDDHSTHVWYTMTNQVHPTNHSHRSSSSSSSNHQPLAPEQRDINNNNEQQQQLAIEVNNSRHHRDHHHSHHQSHHHHHHQPKSSSNDLHLTLYWAAIQQLPPEHLQQQQQQQQSSASGSSSGQVNGGIDAQAELNSASKCYDRHGNLLNEQEESISYFECHYGPCVRIERQPREFSICGRCQETRYCGTTCQQLDWPYHKRYCRYKARRTSLAPYSYQQRSSTSSGISQGSSSFSNSTSSSPSRRFR